MFASGENLEPVEIEMVSTGCNVLALLAAGGSAGLMMGAPMPSPHDLALRAPTSSSSSPTTSATVTLVFMGRGYLTSALFSSSGVCQWLDAHYRRAAAQLKYLELVVPSRPPNLAREKLLVGTGSLRNRPNIAIQR